MTWVRLFSCSVVHVFILIRVPPLTWFRKNDKIAFLKPKFSRSRSEIFSKSLNWHFPKTDFENWQYQFQYCFHSAANLIILLTFYFILYRGFVHNWSIDNVIGWCNVHCGARFWWLFLLINPFLHNLLKWLEML